MLTPTVPGPAPSPARPTRRRLTRRSVTGAFTAILILTGTSATAQMETPSPEDLPAGTTDEGVPVYHIDPAHSSVLFAVSHMDFAAIHGRFNEITGEIAFDPDQPEASRVQASLATESVDTGHPERDEALRSDLFLNAEASPEITFESDSISVTGERRGEVTGTLTLAGTAREITLDVRFNRQAPHPLDESLTVAGFTASTRLARSDFGAGFGLPEIGDTVEVQINVEALRQQSEN